MKHHTASFSAEQRAAAFGHMRVESLSVRAAGRTVLANVSLEVATGEVVALLGRDGAGKTVCLEAIAGLTRASEGRVKFNEVDITDLPSDHRAALGLGYLPEEVSIFRGLTVEENILLALEHSVADATARTARLQRLVADFDLGGVRHQSAMSVSGGERRRCEVARAMALNPTILLLDEPFRGLDPSSVSSTKRMILGLKRRNVGVLVSDYDLHDLLQLTDRVYVLNEGHLIFNGSADELLSDADVRRVFLGESFSL